MKVGTGSIPQWAKLDAPAVFPRRPKQDSNYGENRGDPEDEEGATLRRRKHHNYHPSGPSFISCWQPALTPYSSYSLHLIYARQGPMGRPPLESPTTDDGNTVEPGSMRSPGWLVVIPAHPPDWQRSQDAHTTLTGGSSLRRVDNRRRCISGTEHLIKCYKACRLSHGPSTPSLVLRPRNPRQKNSHTPGTAVSEAAAAEDGEQEPDAADGGDDESAQAEQGDVA